MCAEAVPWRCHRSLIADALVVRGIRVADIISGKRSQIHSLASFARVRGNRITYPLAATGPSDRRSRKKRAKHRAQRRTVTSDFSLA
jgi:hypothetical protein